MKIELPDDWNKTIRTAAESLAKESGGDADEIEKQMLVIAAFPAAVNKARAEQEARRGQN